MGLWWREGSLEVLGAPGDGTLRLCGTLFQITPYENLVCAPENCRNDLRFHFQSLELQRKKNTKCGVFPGLVSGDPSQNGPFR